MKKPIPAVHVRLNTFYQPNQPTASRCVALGKAIGRAVNNYNRNLRVAVCGSGGLSHFVIDEEFDQRVNQGLKTLDMNLLASLPEEYFISGTSEIKNWITTAAIVNEGGLKNSIVGGEPILSSTISLRTVESEIANSLTKVQDDNQDVEIGSYPFFQAGKLGVSIVIRSEDQNKIDSCNSQILEFVNKKKIKVVDR